MSLLYGQGEKSFSRLLEEVARRATTIDTFMVHQKKRCFFHIHVDANVVNMFPSEKFSAWTQKDNTALVMCFAEQSYSFNLVLANYLSFQITFRTDLSNRPAQSQRSQDLGVSIGVTRADTRIEWKEQRVRVELDIRNNLSLVITGAEEKSMRRSDTRVFTILVRLGEKTDQTPLKILGSPHLVPEPVSRQLKPRKQCTITNMPPRGLASLVTILRNASPQWLGSTFAIDLQLLALYMCLQIFKIPLHA